MWHAARDLRVEDVPEPDSPAPGHALVRVAVACICASDVAEYRDGPHVIPTARPHPLTGRMAPLTLGHEYSGVVIALGDGVREVAVGDRVCGDACLRCGHCFWCKRGAYNICASGAAVGLHSDGAFAPVLEVPAYSLYRVPDSVSDLEASVAEPMAVGIHALKRAGFEAGETVTVFGFGMVGAAISLMAQTGGAARIFVIERSSVRRRLAARMGLETIDPESTAPAPMIKRETSDVGSDVVADCTGQPQVLATAVECARRGGRIAVTGISHAPAELGTDRLVYFEREVIGCLGYAYDHPAVLSLLGSGRIAVQPLLSEPIPLHEIIASGFERHLVDQDAPLRIPVVPG